MRRVQQWDWAAAGLALALGAAHWLPAREPLREGEPWHWWLALADAPVVAVVVSAVLLWMRAGDRRSGALATVAPLASTLAVGSLAGGVIAGQDGATPLALVLAVAQAVACFAVTGFARLRSRDWRVDAGAVALLTAMFLPWVTQHEEWFFAVLDGTIHRSGWDWIGKADVLVLVAVLTALLSVHARGFFGDRAIASRAAVAALAVVGWPLVTWPLRPDDGLVLELRYGAFFTAAAAVALVWSTSGLTRPARVPGRTRRAP